MKKMNDVLRENGRLVCSWVATGDPKAPLACAWANPKAAQTAATPFSADEIPEPAWARVAPAGRASPAAPFTTPPPVRHAPSVCSLCAVPACARSLP